MLLWLVHLKNWLTSSLIILIWEHIEVIWLVELRVLSSSLQELWACKAYFGSWWMDLWLVELEWLRIVSRDAVLRILFCELIWKLLLIDLHLVLFIHLLALLYMHLILVALVRWMLWDWTALCLVPQWNKLLWPVIIGDRLFCLWKILLRSSFKFLHITDDSCLIFVK